MKKTIKIKPKTKICKECNRELPLNTDYFFKKCDTKDGYTSRCKECLGRKFTNKLTHIPKDGYQFCKKCDRELPYTFQYFPEDKTTKTGLRNICRECNPSYGRFLKDDECPHRKWTDKELELLKEVYKDYTGLELKEKFFPDRSVRALECEASILGINYKTEETKRRANVRKAKINSEHFKGRIFTEEWKKKISETKLNYFRNHDGTRLGQKNSEETRRRISESKKKAGKWKGEDNPRHKNPLFGSNNGRWQGGITDTYRTFRNFIGQWQRDSMEFCKYKCVITNGDFDNIHHTTPFKDITIMVLNNLNISMKPSIQDYSEEESESINKELNRLHMIYGFGACLDEEVHKLFHDNYGYTKIGINNFLDFVYRIDVGEFDKWFKNHNKQIKINYNYIKYLEEILFNLEEIAA